MWHTAKHIGPRVRGEDDAETMTLNAPDAGYIL